MELRKEENPSRRRSGRTFEIAFAVIALIGLGSMVGLDRERFTQSLGLVAVAAFAATFLWIVVTIARDASARNRAAPLARGIEAELEAAARLRQREFAEEVARLERSGVEFVEEAVSAGRQTLPELIAYARHGSKELAATFARLARIKGESKESLAERFSAEMEAQWQPIRSDLGYAASSEIEAKLLQAIEFQAFAESVRIGSGPVLQDLSTAAERAQSAAKLFAAVRMENLSSLRNESIAAIEPFLEFYERYLREWIGNTVFRLVIMLREQSKNGATLDDTAIRGRVVRLKNILETLARFAEKLGTYRSKAGDQKAVVAQFAFACYVLGIVEQLPTWFPEMGGNEEAEAETRSGDGPRAESPFEAAPMT